LTAQEYIQSGAIESYIFGLADEAEARELEQMRAQHTDVNEAFLRFEAELEQQSMQAAIAPPADVKNKIMAAIGITEEDSRVKVFAMPPKRRQWTQYAAAACVAIMFGSVFMNFILMGRVKNMNAEISDLKIAANNKPADSTKDTDSQFAFFKDPNLKPVAMYGTPTHEVCNSSLYWDKKTGKAYIVIHHLFEQADDKDYQLWAIVDGKPVSIGIFRPGDKMKPLIMNNVPDKASMFAVTLEKKGGSPTPTMKEMYLKGQMTL